ncbi:MAG: cupin domain-containing protein [Gaiellaceae bacterium]
MAAAQGFVIDEHEVPDRREDGDTAAQRLTIDASRGCERLEQRVIRFGPGRSRPRTLGDRQEVLYVARGAGAIEIEGGVHELEPETGVYVAPDETYVIDNPGPDDLLVVSVAAPAEQADGGRRRVTVHSRDQPVLPAGTDREFRYLINQDAGCRDVTQFVGTIPPGRAPMHSHTYDEVVYVLEGTGVLHIDGRTTELGPGSCLHLPPLVMHCLENSGDRPLRVLGVFHPSGDPASRAAEALV